MSCEGAREEITRPHGGKMSGICARDAGFEASEYGKSGGEMLCLHPSHVGIASTLKCGSKKLFGAGKESLHFEKLFPMEAMGF